MSETPNLPDHAADEQQSAAQSPDPTATTERLATHDSGPDMPHGDEVIGAGAGNTTEKDPDDWVTGDEPMTGAQKSYLDTLAREAGETLPAGLTKAEASEHIERLQSATGRGNP